MASTNQKSSSQRHFTFMKTHFAPKSPILGERDSSVDELDNVSVTNVSLSVFIYQTVEANSV
ncbi:predicted protein [Botrytis cinerea T4]|uniref:Uncharacterized protein n=1 Tax=Botryotinia fuckeliana (strain T4) TaxID=999810 RepID=G2YHA2_BOTF4|nr:predicted protein [Botrytis cinerea T4]